MGIVIQAEVGGSTYSSLINRDYMKDNADLASIVIENWNTHYSFQKQTLHTHSNRNI